MDQEFRLTDLDDLASVLDLLTDGIMLFDRELRVRAYNAAYARIFELEPDEIKPGDHLDTVLRVLSGRGMLDTAGERAEEEILRRVATWRSPQNRHEMRRLRSGRLIEITRRELSDGGMISIHVELTGQEERERELERQRGLLQNILANLGEGVALVDANARLIAFNDRALELYGVPRGAVRWGVHFSELAQHFSDLAGLPPERRQLEIDRRYRFLCDPMRTRIVRNLFDGRSVEVVKSVLPGGECVLTMRDITNELRRRRELDEARRQAEENSRHKSSFVAHLSHEMRNSLNGILGVVALLDRSNLSERERSHLELISTSGRMLLRLIDDALDLSRIEAETNDIHAEPLLLPEILAETAALVEPMASEKGLALERDLRGSGVPTVLGDPVRIKQVILNLLTNAVKFTESGTVTLGLVTELGQAAVHARITVEDTGIGIPPEQCETVFRAFYQLNDGRPQRAGGAGLGLAICHRLVSAMGGTIRAEPRAGGGTRFTVALRLPLADEDLG